MDTDFQMVCIECGPRRDYDQEPAVTPAAKQKTPSRRKPAAKAAVRSRRQAK